MKLSDKPSGLPKKEQTPSGDTLKNAQNDVAGNIDAVLGKLVDMDEESAIEELQNFAMNELESLFELIAGAQKNRLDIYSQEIISPLFKFMARLLNATEKLKSWASVRDALKACDDAKLLEHVAKKINQLYQFLEDKDPVYRNFFMLLIQFQYEQAGKF